MERAEWLKGMRRQAEALYDQLAPAYWNTFGLYANETHQQFIRKLLEELNPPSHILDAACGAGRYDGMLLEAGHSVLGIDQSSKMLRRAREHFPEERFPKLRYEIIALQDMSFREEFDAAICVDALEHVCPEDWPGILDRFQKALKPGGAFYFTVEEMESQRARAAYERAEAQGLPVVPGEVVDQVDAAYAEIKSKDWRAIPGERAAVAVYHYYPSQSQVHGWLDAAGMAIQEEGTAEDYWHILAHKKRL